MKALNVPKNSIPRCLQLQAQRAVGMATVLKSDQALNYPLKYYSVSLALGRCAGIPKLWKEQKCVELLARTLRSVRPCSDVRTEHATMVSREETIEVAGVRRELYNL